MDDSKVRFGPEEHFQTELPVRAGICQREDMPERGGLEHRSLHFGFVDVAGILKGTWPVAFGILCTLHPQCRRCTGLEERLW